MPEDSIFNDLGDSANFKKARIIKVLAYPCNKVPVVPFLNTAVGLR
jgi:hypothetical protein